MMDNKVLNLADKFGIKDIMPIRVMLVDDHPILVQGMEDFLIYSKLEGEPIDWVGAAKTLEEARIAIIKNKPDFLILDIWMNLPGGKRSSSLPLIRDIKKLFDESLPIVIYTGDTENKELLSQYRDHGVQGLVFKHEPLEQVLEAIYSIYTGLTYFSPEVRKNTGWFHDVLDEYQLRLRLPDLSCKEKVYLYCALHGNSKRDFIAQKMKITVSTVSEYRARTFAKLKITHINQLDKPLTLNLLKEFIPKLTKIIQ